jgi:hypothetical protein
MSAESKGSHMLWPASVPSHPSSNSGCDLSWGARAGAVPDGAQCSIWPQGHWNLLPAPLLPLPDVHMWGGVRPGWALLGTCGPVAVPQSSWLAARSSSQGTLKSAENRCRAGGGSALPLEAAPQLPRPFPAWFQTLSVPRLPALLTGKGKGSSRPRRVGVLRHSLGPRGWRWWHSPCSRAWGRRQGPSSRRVLSAGLSSPFTVSLPGVSLAPRWAVLSQWQNPGCPAPVPGGSSQCGPCSLLGRSRESESAGPQAGVAGVCSKGSDQPGTKGLTARHSGP